MRSLILCSLIPAIFLSGCGRDDRPALAPVKPVTDTYFGVEIRDPYRYMENMDDTLFLNWMKAYADYSKKVIDGIPGRSSLIELYTEFDGRSSDRVYGLSISENGRYFYLKMTPEDEFGKLYYRDAYETEEVLLYDPADFQGEPGITFVIGTYKPDIVGETVLVGLAPNGSESLTGIIIDVESGKVLDDRLQRVFGGITWLGKGKGLLYGQTNSSNVHDPDRMLNTKIYHHKPGDPQEADAIVFSSKSYPSIEMRPEEIPVIIYDNDEDDYYLLLSTVDRYLKLFYADPGAFSRNMRFDWTPLTRSEDRIQDFNVRGDELYLYTAKDAPGFEIRKTSKTAPDIDGAEMVVAAPENGMISGFSFTSEALYYKLKINGVEERLFRLPNGGDSAMEIELPAKAGSLGLRTRGYKHDDIWVGITGWTMDGMRYRYEAEADRFTEEPLSSMAAFPEYSDLVVEELMVPSHDGVRVPLSVIYHRGTKLDGTAPAIMTGYGAYGISHQPSFNPYTLSWTLQGGVVAIAHVRGGGELGDSWRLSGYKQSKPNTWKDFIACGEYLVNNQYTASKALAMYGGSAGGILIGRTMTERPDLFAAAMPLVGLMNPMRVEQSPNGPVNTPEFGTVEDSSECMALIEMDAYLHIEDDVDYPATLITAGFNDPRVIVWQPAKFAARLQAANGSEAPILFDVDYTSGHGVGDTKSKKFEDLADIFTFGLWQTGHPDFQPE